MEVTIHAKERQAAEANKNASILLQELDQEKVCIQWLCAHGADTLCDAFIMLGSQYVAMVVWRDVWIILGGKLHLPCCMK